jgi:transcriptional regulator with XRE-family HTH domain
LSSLELDFKPLAAFMLTTFGRNLFAARARLGMTQKELASAVGVGQADISQMENSLRLPSAEQWLRLADALHVSMQWFLTGSNRPGLELRDIAVQLQELGIRDLYVKDAAVPFAFLPPEQVIVAAMAGEAPSPRILEAMPAVLAWNTWDLPLLRAYSEQGGRRTLNRLRWLADVALTIHRNQGFPGGCPAMTALETWTANPDSKEPFPQANEAPDSLGYDSATTPVPPVSKRWRIAYPATLAAFRDRAKRLHSLAAGNLFQILKRM